jgi:tripartite-type tricarboxylate transporter receptor subunit TctC
MRRQFLIALLSCLGGAAFAQEPWPTKPLRMVVPAPVGLGPDIFARIYAEHLSKALGQAVFVDNRPGVSGVIGTESALRMADGHTIIYGFNQLVTINPLVFSKLPYNADTDLLPVAQTLTGTYVLVASPAFGPNTLAEMVALAGTKQDGLSYASYGPGSVPHLLFLLLQDAAAVQLVHVPYKQSALPDVIAGHVPMVFEPMASALPFVRSGKLKALAVTTAKRLSVLPEVATMSETIPGFGEVVGWQGVFMPKGTPGAVVDRLETELVRITRLPEVSGRIRDAGFEPSTVGAADLSGLIQHERAAWARAVKGKNIRLD